MFVQVIEGKVSDPDFLQQQNDRWVAELKPGASGYLGSTGGVTPDGRSLFLARFESEAAAKKNSARPEQGAWWNETVKAYDGAVTFHDCREVDELLGGGSNDAGFVQVIQGRAKDQAEMRRQAASMETELRARRPDILGMLIAWHGDGGFTHVVYFTSEAAARKGEQANAQDASGDEYMAMFDGPPTFFDLTQPQLD